MTAEEREERRLRIEEQKLEIEWERMLREKKQLSWSRWSLFIPMVILAGTIAANALVVHQQTRTQFELKVVETVFNSSNVTGSRNRQRALKILFPERLHWLTPDSLLPLGQELKSLDKRGLLDLLVRYPDREAQIVRLWTEMYPADREFLPRRLSAMLPAFEETQPSSP
jgi:hypothetical protein